jgi:thymidine phosphorylase
MEVLARVDVSVDEMKEVVAACRGCLVWGGHVNLSPADDILISVERPLCLDTREQMVASIISKKLAAGSTHLLIDLPVGPTAKLANAGEAMRLRKLFEFVGDQFGIAVEVITTDGRQPIGNGIGPVLEAADVMAVPDQRAGCPADLREKSLRLAGASPRIRSAIARWCGLCARPRVARQRRRLEENAGDHRRAGTFEVPQRYRQADLRCPGRR